MALAPSLSNAAANVAAEAVVAMADGGYLRVYDGTKPANSDTAITSQVLLAETTLASPAINGSASAGVATLDTITPDSSANATGTATWFRVFASDGTTALWDGTVGTSGANLNLNSVSIVSGATVSVSSFTYTQSKT